MPSRRHLLSMATVASLSAVAGCTQTTDSPPQFELRNTADRKLEVNLKVVSPEGDASNPQTVDAGVGEMWTWQYWVEAGEKRAEPGPMRGSDAYLVQARLDDETVAEHWMHGYERAVVTFDASDVAVSIVDPE